MKLTAYQCLECGCFTISKYDGLRCDKCKGPLTPKGEAILHKDLKGVQRMLWDPPLTTVHTKCPDSTCSEKPPVGIKPKWLHDEQRAQDLYYAMMRYTDAGVPIPKEWIEEYRVLLTVSRLTRI